ncbi:LrgB family protein [Paenibacillus sp. sgz302251]|uniref:LrgB family protein n=1 Tax=Paenibacillus sp. sgz302251 TaxID=3414493 RepID=UPI003C7A0255
MELGIPELTGVFTAFTGLLGSMIGPALLRFTGIRSNIGIGTASLPLCYANPYIFGCVRRRG